MKLLSLKEVAARLAVSTSTARRMILRHKVRGYAIEGQWRVEEESVNEYLAMNAFVNFDEQRARERDARTLKGDPSERP